MIVTMGKHHKKSKKAPSEEVEVDETELERFAGSSEEEDDPNNGDPEDASDNDDDSSIDEDEAIPMKKAVSQETENSDSDSSGEAEDAHEGMPLDDEYNAGADDEGDSSDEEEAKSMGMGMANAMSRILGTVSSASSSKPIVLSKTVTPLQKQAAKEKQETKEAQEKRRLNKERKELTCLHMPLSVATSATLLHSNKTSIAKELEREKTHRRVATRGVVALFNAIAQHQKGQQNPNSSAATSSESTSGPALNKHEFLDKIKSSVATKVPKAMASNNTTNSLTGRASDHKTGTNSSKPQWNALQDDFLLNPKKNWDQSDDDDDDDVSSLEEENTKPKSKKARVAA